MPFDAGRIGRLAGIGLSVVGFRVQPAGFDPRSGEGARRFGGRFNPPHSFAVIYLCATRPCVVAELTRQARRQGVDVEDLLPRELWRFTATLTKVLDLTDSATLDTLGLEASDLVRDELWLPREIGEAAYEGRFQAIRSPSATGVDHVVAILPDNLGGSSVEAALVEEWTSVADLT